MELPAPSVPPAFRCDPCSHQLLCVCSQQDGTLKMLTARKRVWRSLNSWSASPMGQEKRKCHWWAKEVLETEWKLGTKTAFFCISAGTCTPAGTTTEHKLLGVPEKVYITHNSSYNPSFKRGREREERVQHSPESIKSSPADGEVKTHGQLLVPWKFKSIWFWGKMVI